LGLRKSRSLDSLGLEVLEGSLLVALSHLEDFLVVPSLFSENTVYGFCVFVRNARNLGGIDNFHFLVMDQVDEEVAALVAHELVLAVRLLLLGLLNLGGGLLKALQLKVAHRMRAVRSI